MKRVFAVSPWFWCLACGPSDGGMSVPPVEVWDSGGVQIVQSNQTLEETREGWSVSKDPVVLISSDPVNPDGVLHWIRDATILSDGRIAVLSESDKDLKFFSPSGVLQSVAGRDGDGPGEFRAPFELVRTAGDTLVVRDRGVGRISWFSSEGEFLWSLSPNSEEIRAVAPPEYPILSQLLTIPQSYAVWVAAAPGKIQYQQRFRTLGAIFLSGLDGSDPILLGPYAGREHFFLREGVGRFAFFWADTFLAAGVGPLRIYIGDSMSFEIRVFDAAGNQLRVIRDAVPPTAISSREVEWERWELLDFVGRFGLTEPYEELADQMPIPSKKPAFEDLIVDSEGFLWVKEYSSYRPDPVRYRIFSSDGTRVGVVDLPGRLKVHEIGVDYILGIHIDTDYVETIQVYSVDRPAKPGGIIPS